LPAFARRAAGDISAEVFSMSEPSAWRSLVETATSIKDKPHDDDDDNDDDLLRSFAFQSRIQKIDPQRS